jgi:hypothetical protein
MKLSTLLLLVVATLGGLSESSNAANPDPLLAQLVKILFNFFFFRNWQMFVIS